MCVAWVHVDWTCPRYAARCRRSQGVSSQTRGRSPRAPLTSRSGDMPSAPAIFVLPPMCRTRSPDLGQVVGSTPCSHAAGPCHTPGPSRPGTRRNKGGGPRQSHSMQQAHFPAMTAPGDSPPAEPPQAGFCPAWADSAGGTVCYLMPPVKPMLSIMRRCRTRKASNTGATPKVIPAMMTVTLPWEY